jgi:hypothetical protein
MRTLALSLCLLSASAFAQLWTDPAKAAAEDPDFLIQGDYVSEAGDMGAQVVALSKGKFDVYVLTGGLPGAGWDRSKARVKVTVATKDGAISGSGADIAVTIADGSLTVKGGKGDSVLKRVERESETLGAKAPAGARVLFDGSSADQWQNGKLDGDLLQQGTKSKAAFGSHFIHLEFRTPYKPAARGQGRGNSGLYMQSRYETQILDSFALEGKMNECGGVYSIAKSDVNMCFPPLRWQTYDVDFTEAKFENGKKVANGRMTVRLNGVVIHDNLELTHSTTASPQKENAEPGPVYIQNHGNPVRFRNIWVVEK